jgi:ABC-type branched-subunit amino acid transport system ATPase component/ABC-type branched-subunit amino acid transport system permease subunit
VGVATGIGVLEQILATDPGANGLIEVVILALVVIALLTTTRGPRAILEPWTQRSLPRVIPAAYRRLAVVRWPPRILAVAALGVALVVPTRATGSQALDLTVVIAMAIVGLSVVVVTGLGGQLTLAQFAYAAIGAAVSVQASADLGYLGGLAVGAVIAAMASVALALAALRVQGIALGVASLIFAIVTTRWLLDRSTLLGDAPAPERPRLTIGDIRTDESRGYYWIALIALVVTTALVARLRSSAWARTLVAVRDNSDAARAMSISARSMKLQAAAVGGFIAGIGGAVYGHAFSNLSSSNFEVQLSIDAVTATVIGGLSSLWGPLIGAAYLLGIPALFSPTAEAATALAGAWIALIVAEPAGVGGLVERATTRLHDEAAAAAGIDVERARRGAVGRDDVNPDLGAEPCAVTESDVILGVHGVSKRYGGLMAVSDVSFEVAPKEIVGLIGPNGAGKTTLFEIISGFVTPVAGRIAFAGNDVTAQSPEARARAGMARSFQSATLFPTLTLTEAVMVAGERMSPSSLLEAFGPGRRDDERREMARALLTQFELGDDAESLVGTLPTGTRRIAELACAVAARPRLILLDEPSAGVAHSESERLAVVLRAIRDELGITLVLIEHDLPLLFAVCDRMVALAAGSKIAEGTPAEVRSHPAVIESYVG